MSEIVMETPACLCGETKTTSRRVAAKDELGQAPFTYVRCAACGAERLSPRPVAAEIGAFYPESYASHIIRPDSLAARVKKLIYNTFWAPEDRLGALRPVLRVLLYPLRGNSVMAFHPLPVRRVFEFGAATGNDLLLFKAEGWEVDGCEPSARACAMAAERGIAIRTSTAEEAVLAPESVSAILINNVLEHTHAPEQVLAMCARGLMPGGSLVIVVPNHASWSAALFGAAWPGYDAPRHIWGFTPDSLRAAIDRTGLRTERVHQMFPGRWAWRGTMDGRHAQAPVPAWRRENAGLLALALLPLGWLAAACGHGDFMTVVATKPRG